MKIKKIIIPLFLILLGLSWYSTLSFGVKKAKKYNEYVEKAKKYEEKHIYIDALDMYKKALKYSDAPLETHKLVLNMYRELKDFRNYEKYSSDILKEYKYPTDIVLDMLMIYELQKRPEKAVELLTEATKHNKAETLKEKKAEYLGAYKERYLYYDLVDITGDKYYIYEENSKRGLLSLGGEEVLQAEYDAVKSFGAKPEYAAVLSGEEWYMVDNKGRRKLVPDIPVEYLGIYSDNLIPYRYEDKYSYFNEEMHTATEENFDYASNFNEGFAAVKRGDKWAVINKKFEDINGYIYEDIVLDSNEKAINNKIFIAKVDNKYGIYDVKGKLLSDTYDYIKTFISKEPAAYKKGDKWGYIDMQGQVVIEAMYEDADGFSDGLAPVLFEGKWGYIDKDNVFRVENTLEKANILRNAESLIENKGYRIYKFIR